MIRKILWLCMFLFAFMEYGLCRPVLAEEDDNRVLMVTYPITPEAVWRGDTLTLSFTCTLKGRLENPLSFHVAPLYISGRDTLHYPPINCLTPSGARFRNRRSGIRGAVVAENNLVVRKDARQGIPYRYQESLVVPRSLNGKLRILHYVQDCCNTWHLEQHEVAVPSRAVVVTDTVYRTVEFSRSALPPPVAAVSVPLFETNVTFVKPLPETVKKRSASVSVRINYPVNHWQVNPSYRNNSVELNRVHELLSSVHTDKDVYTVSDITITGYASPEAPFYHNLQLTQKRADGMRDYLLQRYSLSGCNIRTIGMGEDWEGLRRAIAESGMSAKQELLSIIDRYDIFNSREKHLMELHGGEPYRYMLRHLFPALRRMEMKIDYTVRSFGTDEAGAFIEDRPQDLSLEEIYSLARSQNSNRTIRHHRDEYGKQYDIAVRYYPHDAAANINAASAALVRGDMEQAWVYLSKVQDNPLAFNNIGVYCWLCGKVADARRYFHKAMEVDADRAAYNLRQLDKWEEKFGYDGDPPSH